MEYEEKSNSYHYALAYERFNEMHKFFNTNKSTNFVALQFMMSQPLVSVCIPTYNGAVFLQEALDSVLAQTYDNLEVVLSDDQSTDGSWELLDRFRESAPFPVHLHSHEPQGIGANWNHTLEHASGKYIKFLFQDDILKPDCIEKMVQFMEGNEVYGLIACKRKLLIDESQSIEAEKFVKSYSNLQRQFDFDGDVLHLDKSMFKMKHFFLPPKNKIGEPPTVLFKKEILKDVGYFDESFKQILDYVFFYRVLKKFPIAILKEELVLFRVHSNQTTQLNIGKELPEYDLYNKIIYKEFFSLMHPKIQLQLKKRYHPVYRLLVALKRGLERIIGRR